MKKFLSFIAFITIAIFTNAQALQEVVYLKNGSVIRGTIIEQRPNESIKIQTADGSIFVYQMTDIERMTKENSTLQNTTSTNNNSTEINTDINYPNHGYRGFADFYVGFGKEDLTRISISTVHGFQINKHLFIGGGFGYQHWAYREYDTELESISFFADFQYSILAKKISPFLDVRMGGYNVNEGSINGFYNRTTFGARFKHFSVFAGAELFPYKYEDYYGSSTDANGAFILGVSIDWGSRH